MIFDIVTFLVLYLYFCFYHLSRGLDTNRFIVGALVPTPDTIALTDLPCSSSYALAMSQYIYLMTAHLIHRIIISPRFPTFPFPSSVCLPGHMPFDATSNQVGRQALRWTLPSLPLPIFYSTWLVNAAPSDFSSPFPCISRSAHPLAPRIRHIPITYALDPICPPWDKTCVVLPYLLRTWTLH